MKSFPATILALFIVLTTGTGTTHTIVSSGFSFSPSNLTINLGDTVVFSLASIHNAVEVSQATWNSNGTTPLPGGFALPLGGGTVVLTSTGTHWYVCQPHALSGMKGRITVDPPAPPPLSTILISSIADQDGSTGTTGDRVGKRWSLKLYRDSVGSGIVVDSTDSATSLLVDSLTAGTYVAVEADSASWTHFSQTVNSVSQGLTPDNFRSLTIGAGEIHTVDFLNTVPNMIINDGFTFVPDTMVVDSADTVWFVLEPAHNAREVDLAAWNGNDTTSNGGFDLPFEGGYAVMDGPGTRYYLCVPHAPVSMKGVIVVNPSGVFTGSVSDGWNLLSLPLKVTDSLVTTLYPDAASSAYTYQAGYHQQTSVTNGAGYWIKFVGGQSVNINGTEFTADTVEVSNGWNIIGSVSAPLDVSAIGSVPGGLITSSFFGYDAGYFTADTIQPGHGYWVKVNAPGSLILSASPSASARAGRIRIVPSSEIPPAPPGGDAAISPDHGGFIVTQNYPNPFNPSTWIRYFLPARSHVRVAVYNLIGEEIATLVDGVEDAGEKRVQFNPGGLPGGVYYYRITAGGYTASGSMILLK